MSLRQLDILQILAGGHSSTLQKFSQPHLEGSLHEQFSSRLCLPPWVTGKLTQTPALSAQPGLWAVPTLRRSGPDSLARWHHDRSLAFSGPQFP